MNEKRYVNAIVRKIKCSGKKRNEIRKQLLTDMQTRIGQGEKLEEIMSRMGSVKEIAAGFNETISAKERKRYVRSKALKIVSSVLVVAAVLLLFLYWFIPKGIPIEESEYFVKEQIEAAMLETIELLDAGDYASLQKNAIEQMQPYLNAETTEREKAKISDDWGKRIQFGTPYMAELVQMGAHYIVGEITVTYENISITYRLTYDQNMRLAGVYYR